MQVRRSLVTITHAETIAIAQVMLLRRLTPARGAPATAVVIGSRRRRPLAPGGASASAPNLPPVSAFHRQRLPARQPALRLATSGALGGTCRRFWRDIHDDQDSARTKRETRRASSPTPSCTSPTDRWQGLKLIGFGIWERKSGNGRNVTFPARQYSVNGERRSFALLRPLEDATGQDRIRELVLQAYAEVEAAAAVGA